MSYDKLIDRLNTKLQSYASYTDSEFAHVIEDAALAIEALRADLARVTAERDGAVHDLEEIMFKGGHNIDTCHFCTNGQCYGRGGTQCCEPKWRGIKED